LDSSCTEASSGTSSICRAQYSELSNIP
jgi:hypothetical protein